MLDFGHFCFRLQLRRIGFASDLQAKAEFTLSGAELAQALRRKRVDLFSGITTRFITESEGIGEWDEKNGTRIVNRNFRTLDARIQYPTSITATLRRTIQLVPRITHFAPAKVHSLAGKDPPSHELRPPSRGLARPGSELHVPSSELHVPSSELGASSRKLRA